MTWDHIAVVAFLAALIYAVRPSGQVAGAVSSLGEAAAAAAATGL